MAANGDAERSFGIRFTLPGGDSMARPHLLGEGWESFRWYATREQRDRAYEDVVNQPAYYRRGDSPSQIVEKVER